MTNVFLDDLPLIVSRVPDYRNFKDYLLDLIDQMPNLSIDSTNCSAKNDQIKKSDWNLPLEHPRPYLDFIKPKLIETVTESFHSLNLDLIQFHNFWFQQYHNEDLHDWHVHQNCHFANVFFLELPDTDYKTQIQNFNRRKIIDYNVSEGDILTFPSFLYHRSPKNYSTLRKTIISFNFTLTSSTGNYV